MYWSQCGITAKRFLARLLVAILSSFFSTMYDAAVTRLHLECFIDFVIMKVKICKSPWVPDTYKLTFNYSKADWKMTDVEDDIDISLVLPVLTSTSLPGSFLFPFLGTPRKGRSETLGARLVWPTTYRKRWVYPKAQRKTKKSSPCFSYDLNETKQAVKLII